MASESDRIRIGAWVVTPELAEISCDGRTVALRPQVLDLLLYLAGKQGEVVSTEELMNELWANKVVTEGAVYNTLAELRSHLATADDGLTYLQTIPKKGYRLVAPVDNYESENSRSSRADAAGFPRFWRDWSATLLGLVLVCVASAITWFVVFSANTPTSDVDRGNLLRRFTIELPRTMPDFGRAYSPVLISNDGSALLFGGDVDEPSPIRRRQFGGFAVTEIAGTENAGGIFAISPAGDAVAFVDHSDRLLKKVALDGGVPITVADPGDKVWGMAWAPDGSIVYEAGNHRGLMSIDPGAESPLQLTNPDQNDTHKHPSFSADGQILFFAIGERGSTTRKTDRVAALSLHSGKYEILLPGSSPVATGGDHLMFYRDGALWICKFDSKNLAIIGEPLAVAQNVHYENHAHYGVSDDGTLVYVDDYNLSRRHLLWVDQDGEETIITRDPMPYITPRLSADGSRIAVVIDSREGADLWIYSLDRGTLTRLTHDDSREASPVWSNDGSFIVYSSNRVDDLFMVKASDPYTIEQLTASPTYQFAYSLTPDDRFVLYTEAASNTQRVGDLMRLSLAGEERPKTLLASPYSEYQPAISPDGRWLAYISDRSGLPEVYLRPYMKSNGGELQISVDGGKSPRWKRDGSAIVYRGPTDLMITEVQLSTEVRIGPAMSLLSLENFEYYDMGNFDISPEGYRFLMVKTADESEFPASRVVVVQNWLDDAVNRLSQE